MPHDEQQGNTVIHRPNELVVRTPEGEYKPMDYQLAYDVLKSLNLDHHINEEERRLFQVQ